MTIALAKSLVATGRFALRANEKALAKHFFGEALEALRGCDRSDERTHLISVTSIVYSNI